MKCKIYNNCNNKYKLMNNYKIELRLLKELLKNN